MNIIDLPYLSPISQAEQVKGAFQYDGYDNRAVALAHSYADGLDVIAVAGTSIYLDRGFSRSQSFSVAQSSG